MNTLKFTAIMIRLAGFYFITSGLETLTYLPGILFRSAHGKTLPSHDLYDMEVKISIVRITLYFILSVACCCFAPNIARIFARGLENDATLISP